MPQIGNLLINGCSHMEGSECDKSIGDFIAEKLNYNQVNLSKGGGSNHRILRTTIEHCENNDVDLVFIGWTTHERFEFAWRGQRADYTLYKQSEDKDLEKFYRYIDLNVADWNIGLEDTLMYQLALQTYLEKKNIDYIYCNMYNFIPNNCQIPLWQSIDQTKYYKPHDSFIETYMKLSPSDFSETMHIKNISLHEEIADKLIEIYKWRYFS